MEEGVHLPKVRTMRRGGNPYTEAERTGGSTPVAGPSTAASGSLSRLGPWTGPRPLREDPGEPFASLSEALIRVKATFSKKKKNFF